MVDTVRDVDTAQDPAALDLEVRERGGAPEPAGGDAAWLLRMRDVRFSYPNGLQALAGIDLEVNAGEVLSLIGPSGCGKSTIISTVAGLNRPDGRIEWNPDQLRDVDGRSRRLLNVVFQKNTVMPWLTVEKNVAFGLRYLDVGKREAEERVTHLLEMVGLAEFRKAYPAELSGGMLRRVALLAGVAKLLILDEPFSALDEPTRITVHRDLLKLVRDFNMSVLLITHDLGEAISLSDRVGILTRRPAQVAEIHDIPLGPDRDVEQIRSTATFQQSYQRLWIGLWEQIGGTR